MIRLKISRRRPKSPKTSRQQQTARKSRLVDRLISGSRQITRSSREQTRSATEYYGSWTTSGFLGGQRSVCHNDTVRGSEVNAQNEECVTNVTAWDVMRFISGAGCQAKTSYRT